jgi:NAD(P)H-flavin reductase
LWLVDRVVRAYRSSRGCRVIEFKPIDCGVAGHVVRLRVRAAGAVDRFVAGQYVFLNVAELSLYEWHPFTIASIAARTPGELEFLIKSSGYATWTSRLYGMANAHIMRSQDGEHAPGELRRVSDHGDNDNFKAPPAITLSIDGPYGGQLEMSRYQTVLLLAGGIGITPIKSHFDTIRAAHRHAHAVNSPMSPELNRSAFSPTSPSSRCPSRVHLMWVLRDPSLVSLLRESLDEATGPGTPFTVRLFLSDRGQWEAEQRDLKPDSNNDLPRSISQLIVRHRPDLDAELDKGLAHIDGSSTLLFVCGPDSMVADARVVAARHGWDFHHETFEL